MAPQRNKARSAQHQTEAKTGPVSGDSHVQGQHRCDMEEEATAVAASPAEYATSEHPPGWEQCLGWVSARCAIQREVQLPSAYTIS